LQNYTLKGQIDVLKGQIDTLKGQIDVLTRETTQVQAWGNEFGNGFVAGGTAGRC